MIPATRPIRATETELLDLIKSTKSTQRPLILTMEGGAEPVAVLMKIDDFEQTQRQQYRLYHLQLTRLKEWLDRVELQWDDGAIRQECVATWQNSIMSLWEVAPDPVQEFCAALILSVRQLDAKEFAKCQVVALRYCLDLLRDSDPSETVKVEAYRHLNESGIPPLLSYENTLLQLYLDEL